MICKRQLENKTCPIKKYILFLRKKRMGQEKQEKRKGCVIEIPTWFGGIEKIINDDRRDKGLPAYSKALILESMITEGANHDWKRHLERLHMEKIEGQVGRGRPRKQD